MNKEADLGLILYNKLNKSLLIDTILKDPLAFSKTNLGKTIFRLYSVVPSSYDTDDYKATLSSKNKPIKIIFTGMGDASIGYSKDIFKKKFPNEPLYFFGWPQYRLAMLFAARLPLGTPILVFGHSWGSDSARRFILNYLGNIIAGHFFDPMRRDLKDNKLLNIARNVPITYTPIKPQARSIKTVLHNALRWAPSATMNITLLVLDHNSVLDWLNILKPNLDITKAASAEIYNPNLAANFLYDKGKFSVADRPDITDASISGVLAGLVDGSLLTAKSGADAAHGLAMFTLSLANHTNNFIKYPLYLATGQQYFSPKHNRLLSSYTGNIRNKINSLQYTNLNRDFMRKPLMQGLRATQTATLLSIPLTAAGIPGLTKGKLINWFGKIPVKNSMLPDVLKSTTNNLLNNTWTNLGDIQNKIPKALLRIGTGANLTYLLDPILGLTGVRLDDSRLLKGYKSVLGNTLNAARLFNPLLYAGTSVLRGAGNDPGVIPLTFIRHFALTGYGPAIASNVAALGTTVADTSPAYNLLLSKLKEKAEKLGGYTYMTAKRVLEKIKNNLFVPLQLLQVVSEIVDLKNNDNIADRTIADNKDATSNPYPLNLSLLKLRVSLLKLNLYNRVKNSTTLLLQWRKSASDFIKSVYSRYLPSKLTYLKLSLYIAKNKLGIPADIKDVTKYVNYSPLLSLTGLQDKVLSHRSDREILPKVFNLFGVPSRQLPKYLYNLIDSFINNNIKNNADFMNSLDPTVIRIYLDIKKAISTGSEFNEKILLLKSLYPLYSSIISILGLIMRKRTI